MSSILYFAVKDGHHIYIWITLVSLIIGLMAILHRYYLVDSFCFLAQTVRRKLICIWHNSMSHSWRHQCHSFLRFATLILFASRQVEELCPQNEQEQCSFHGAWLIHVSKRPWQGQLSSKSSSTPKNTSTPATIPCEGRGFWFVRTERSVPGPDRLATCKCGQTDSLACVSEFLSSAARFTCLHAPSTFRWKRLRKRTFLRGIRRILFALGRSARTERCVRGRCDPPVNALPSRLCVMLSFPGQ